MRPFRWPLPVPPRAQASTAPADTDGASTAPDGAALPGRSSTRPTRRPCSPPSPSPRRCGSWRSTATTACPSCPPTAARYQAGHRPRRAARHRPPDHHRAPRPPRPSSAPTGTTPTRRAPAAPADPCPVTSSPRSPSPPVRPRPAHAGRRHLAAGRHPVIVLRGDRCAAPARAHPGSRRPRQPAHRGARRLTRTGSRRRTPCPASRRRDQQSCMMVTSLRSKVGGPPAPV